MKKSTLGFFVAVALLAPISANAEVVFKDTFSAGGAIVWTSDGAADESASMNTDLSARQVGGSLGSSYLVEMAAAGTQTRTGGTEVFGSMTGPALLRVGASGSTALDLDTHFGSSVASTNWVLSYTSTQNGDGVGWVGFAVGNPADTPPGSAGTGLSFELFVDGSFTVWDGTTSTAGNTGLGSFHGVEYQIMATFDEPASTVEINYSNATHNISLGTYATGFSDASRFVELKTRRTSAAGAWDWRVDDLQVETVQGPLPPAPLPFLETFEVADGISSGPIDGQNGWVSSGGSADVQSGIFHPGSGSQALQMQSTEVSHDLTNDGSAVWLRFQTFCTGIPSATPAVPADTTLFFFVNPNLNLVVYSNTVPVELSVQVPTNAWVRFDVYCDYDDQYWDLSMDGINVAAGLPLYSTSNSLGSMILGNGSSDPVYVDQIDIADTEQTAGGLPDSDDDEIPDWWEQKNFGGVTSVVAGNTSGNAGLTYLETYIVGVSPFVYDPYVVSVVPDGNGLTWNPVESRWYSVYWAPTLTNGFTLLQGNIEYPQSEFIDSAHAGDDTGFYRLKVQVQ
ncbi:MAG: hypothetical protein DRP64_00370 [Verrucomicrobia bacterium]|nr:MAG: hypothetical protein DRP64_00370 [Verrucomicrobiota bacterium]